MTHYRRAYFHDLNRTGESPAEDGTDFRELLENASDFIYTTDHTGKFTSVNGAGERLTGYSRAELVASNLGQIVAPESLDTVLRIMDQMAKGANPTICELDVVAKDGRKVLVEVNAQPIYRDGKPVGVQGIARDISLRRQADLAIRERAAHLEALNAIIAAADATPDLPLLLEVAIDRILEALSLGMGGIWAGDHHVVRGLSPETGAVIVKAAQGVRSKSWNAAFPDGPNPLAATWSRIGVRASLTVPILAEGRCIGALAVASAYPRPWTREEVDLTEAVAQQVAATAEGLRLFQETHQHARLMGRLIALNETLNRLSSLAVAAAAIGQAATDLSGAKGCAVYARAPEGSFTCLWAKGVSEEDTPLALAAKFVLPPDATDGTAQRTPEGPSPPL